MQSEIRKNKGGGGISKFRTCGNMYKEYAGNGGIRLISITVLSINCSTINLFI